MRQSTPLIAGVCLVLAAGAAAAYEPEKESGGSEKTVLEGPRIDTKPGDAGRPDAGMDEPERAERAEPPFAVYVMHLRSLQRGDDESLRLTDEQAERVRAIAQEHRAAVRAYMEEHREEIRRLRQVSGERPGPGEGPARRMNERGAERPAARPGRGGDAGDEARPERDQNQNRERARERVQTRDGMQPVERNNADERGPSPEQRAAARERLYKLLSDAPGDKAMREKLLGVLTEAQRERVEAAVAARMRMQHAGEDEGRPGARPGQRPDARPAEGERPARRPAQRREGRPGDGG